MLTVKDVLQSKSSVIWSIAPNETAYSAMQIMAEKNIGVLLVIDDDSIAGVVSERDLARNVILHDISPKEMQVETIMTREIYCITTDKSVEECMGVMTTAHVRHMPVFEDKRLKGVVTFGDIVKAVLMEQEIKIQNLEDYHSCCESTAYND